MGPLEVCGPELEKDGFIDRLVLYMKLKFQVLPNIPDTLERIFFLKIDRTCIDWQHHYQNPQKQQHNNNEYCLPFLSTRGRHNWDQL